LKMEDKLQHQLWVGSANATQRAWAGRNFEVVAHLKLKRDVAEGLLEFVNQCQIYLPTSQPRQEESQDEKLESERKRLACAWSPQQQIFDGCLLISSPSPPPLQDGIALQVAPLGHPWLTWPVGESGIRMTAIIDKMGFGTGATRRDSVPAYWESHQDDTQLVPDTGLMFLMTGRRFGGSF